MSGAKTELFKYFQPERYLLSESEDMCQLIIIGRKMGPPSRRITLHQKGLRVLSASIHRSDKKAAAFDVDRINHITSFEQVRLHSAEMLYPGNYQINLSYQSAIKSDKPNRNWLPSIDEPAAWMQATLEIKS